MTNEAKFIQGLTANFVAAELRNQQGSGARRKRLNELMRGGTVITEDETGVTRRQRYTCVFDGVAPITELLDPDWSGPVAPVDTVMQQTQEKAAAAA